MQTTKDHVPQERDWQVLGDQRKPKKNRPLGTGAHKFALANRVCIRCKRSYESTRPCYCDDCWGKLSRLTADEMLHDSSAVSELLDENFNRYSRSRHVKRKD